MTSTAPSAPCTILRAALRNICDQEKIDISIIHFNLSHFKVKKIDHNRILGIKVELAHQLAVEAHVGNIINMFAFEKILSIIDITKRPVENDFPLSPGKPTNSQLNTHKGFYCLIRSTRTTHFSQKERHRYVFTT